MADKAVYVEETNMSSAQASDSLGINDEMLLMLSERIPNFAATMTSARRGLPI